MCDEAFDLSGETGGDACGDGDVRLGEGGIAVACAEDGVVGLLADFGEVGYGVVLMDNPALLADGLGEEGEDEGGVELVAADVLLLAPVSEKGGEGGGGVFGQLGCEGGPLGDALALQNVYGPVEAGDGDENAEGLAGGAGGDVVGFVERDGVACGGGFVGEGEACDACADEGDVLRVLRFACCVWCGHRYFLAYKNEENPGVEARAGVSLS